MKKILNILVCLILPFMLRAQSNSSFQFNEQVFNAVASIFVAILVMIFIVSILKRILDNRLKNKIIDRGISENLASSVLQPSSMDSRNNNIKWFLILAGTGVGFLLINYTLPLGFHSLAIMAFSLSLSFLAYYFFSKKSEK